MARSGAARSRPAGKGDEGHVFIIHYPHFASDVIGGQDTHFGTEIGKLSPERPLRRTSKDAPKRAVQGSGRWEVHALDGPDADNVRGAEPLAMKVVG
jgi:hypothetical protein